MRLLLMWSLQAYMFGVHVGAFHGGVMRIENTEITRSGQAGRCVVIGLLNTAQKS